MFTLITKLKEKFMEPTKEELAKMTPLERYRLHRQSMEKWFVEENRTQENRKVHTSPSGKYQLTVDSYATKKGCWNYSRGRVYEGEKLVADVKRNYGHFPFAWAEKHTNGHDYLLCGEDYQGQTVVELDTGKRVDLEPDEHMDKGFGFCWADIHPSPDKRVIAVDGCYWACPYEVVLYDFSEPMKLPYKVLERWDEAESFDSWETEGKLLLSRTVDVRKSDGKVLYDLPDEEMNKAEADGDVEEKKITKLWEPKSLNEARSAAARKEYERLLREMMKLPAGAETAYEALADQMDGVERAMTEEDRRAMAQLSADLQKTAAPGTWGAQ